MKTPRPSSKRSLVTGSLLVLSALSGVASAQQKPAQPAAPSQEPSVVLKVTTRLVTVDVVARDRHGNTVRDLKADDFQVFEQGTSRKSEQQIASFRLVDRSLARLADVDRAPEVPAGVFTNLVTTSKLSAPPTILLVDGLNTDASTQLQSRKKMVQLLGSAPGDVPMAVFLMGRRLYLLQSFTTDANLLREAAQRAMSSEATNLQVKDPRDDTLSNTSLMDEMGGSPGQNDIPGGAPGLSPSGGAGSGGGTPGGAASALMAMKAALMQRWEKEQYAESVDIRVKLTLDALRTIARHVSGYPGRKNLIWVSSAFPLAIMPDQSATLAAKFTGTRNYANEIAAVASALTDAQIAVYPVDPRGIETEQQFAASSTGRVSNPFSEGATLNRESGLRFSDSQSMHDLAQQTGGQVCLNNNDLSQCIKRAIDDGSSYYELTYYPTDKNWQGEFRRLSVKTRRSGVQLSHREGYFARSSDATISAGEAKDTDNRVMQAACNDFLSATSILVSAKAIPPDQPGQAKYFIAVDPNALSFSSPEGGNRSLHLELGACMFNAHGAPLQYFRQGVDQKFNEAEYQATISTGITHTLSLAPKPETARVRLLVCDTATGMVGSVDVPYSPETSPAPVVQAEARSDSATEPPPSSASTAETGPSTPAAAPHVIKFHDKEGRTGVLQWDTQRIFYSGDLSPGASARGMFDSLWSKSFACQDGRLLSLADRKSPAQQPLHFKSEGHGADVYLDDAAGVKFSGDLVIDPSVKPFFEALRSLYQCKNLGAAANSSNR